MEKNDLTLPGSLIEAMLIDSKIDRMDFIEKSGVSRTAFYRYYRTEIKFSTLARLAKLAGYDIILRKTDGLGDVRLEKPMMNYCTECSYRHLAEGIRVLLEDKIDFDDLRAMQGEHGAAIGVWNLDEYYGIINPEVDKDDIIED